MGGLNDSTWPIDDRLKINKNDSGRLVRVQNFYERNMRRFRA
jgi:hypothetical protein